MCEGEGHRTGARHLDRGSRGAKQRAFCCPLHFLTLGKSDLPWQAALHAGGGTFPAWDYDSGPRARRGESSVQGPGRGPAAGPLPINGPYALWDSLRTRPQSLCALISLSRTPLLRNSAEDEVTEGPGRHGAGGGPACV